VKGVARSNPNLGLDSLALKNLHSSPKFLFLFGGRNTRELGFLFSRNDSPMARNITVLVAVHRNGPTARLPSPNAPPEIPNRRFNLEDRVLVVRHDRQDWLEIPPYQSSFDFRPDLPIHGRTNVIETQKILCAPGIPS